ncbi:MAG: histidinol-phosphate transaminase [Bacteroidaceae bacterium]|nr:histidinol-phosphate transaminase [Bacteroidaceae bacterium]
MTPDWQTLVRPNIWHLAPYSSARDEYTGTDANVFLDANENPYNRPNNRYPDPLQRELKKHVSRVKGVPVQNIFLGNGSDEAIDLIFRVFCRPGKDNVVAIEPTYGMYSVCAAINDIEYRRVPLEADFSMRSDQMLNACSKDTKAIFICSPNNPTGNAIDRKEILNICEKFSGIVVVDEAYGDFQRGESLSKSIDKHPNLVVLSTLSKAWGSAAIRLGMAFACEEVISFFNKVKYPYNVNQLTQDEAMAMLGRSEDVDKWIRMILAERPKVMQAVSLLPCCVKVYPTEANFFLVKMTDADAIYQYLCNRGIVVRNRSRVALCGNCLRITIGTHSENSALIAALRQWN